MFKKAILPLVAVTALSAAVPAAAQSYRGYDRWDQNWDRIDRRFERLDHRIDQGVRNGSLSRREAVRLRADFHTLIQLERRYSINGLNRWERQDLNSRFERLSAQIRYERRDRDDRRGRYGRGDRRGW